MPSCTLPPRRGRLGLDLSPRNQSVRKSLQTALLAAFVLAGFNTTSTLAADTHKPAAAEDKAAWNACSAVSGGSDRSWPSGASWDT